MQEARLRSADSGLAPETAGWFVVNVRDAAWETHAVGDACFFESESVPFDQLGIGVRVLWPGRSRWLYHSESAQEDFLVLSGEALLLVEEQERPLRPWDFVHCPPGTAHAFVAVGDRPCAIVMVGARPAGHTFNYPRSELALRHGVGVESETTSPAEALASFPEWTPLHRNDWGSLPWSDDT
jgi:uncharacterized cupin superfamily protein